MLTHEEYESDLKPSAIVSNYLDFQGRIKGHWHSYDITNGKTNHSCRWPEVPLTAKIIDRAITLNIMKKELKGIGLGMDLN